MFTMTEDELKKLGAHITTAEIMQQPDLWRDTLNIYKTNLDAIEAFLADARAMGEGRLSVVLRAVCPSSLPAPAPPTTSVTPPLRTCVTPVTSPSMTSSPSPPRTSSPPRATS